ncbi:hypothetical protein [Litorisediminicola beolgyonensis]|uniref:Uncharacterized protein n=1 Tax=Litorisediminicola beolgyonensis TaxID=1173614 RepID=A0ABW3ZHW1_9RHOB
MPLSPHAFTAETLILSLLLLILPLAARVWRPGHAVWLALACAAAWALLQAGLLWWPDALSRSQSALHDTYYVVTETAMFGPSYLPFTALFVLFAAALWAVGRIGTEPLPRWTSRTILILHIGLVAAAEAVRVYMVAVVSGEGGGSAGLANAVSILAVAGSALAAFALLRLVLGLVLETSRRLRA